MQEKNNNLDARFREKYARGRNPMAREKRMGAKAKMHDSRQRKKQMDDRQRKLIQERIAKQKETQKLKEKAAKSKEKLALNQKEAESRKKMEKARDRMRAYIHQLENRTATTARQDKAFEEIRKGHTKAGLEELSKAGKTGSFGNEMAKIDNSLVEQSNIISKNGGNGGKDLRDILASNSAPMLTINQGKYALHDEKEQKKGMEKGTDRPQTAFTKDEFLKEKMKERRYNRAA